MNLYIPIEVKSRELVAKTYIAKHAAEADFNVFIGRKNDLNKLVLDMPRGIYLGLGAFENFLPFYRDLAHRGFKVLINEEEGLVTYSDDMYTKMRVSSETLKYVSEVCAWGKENHSVLTAAFPEHSNKFHITGNPRFDLLKKENRKIYEQEIKKIKSTYGQFLLICTSFSSVNHYDKDLDYVQSLIDKKTLRDETDIHRFESYRRVKRATLASFICAIEELSASLPHIQVIIRPHPSENLDLYKRIADKLLNVQVDTRFSVHPWIICAEAIVHHYCTTSIEALAVQTPRYALRPHKDTKSEKEFPFACSVQCTQPELLVKELSSYLSQKTKLFPLNACRQDYDQYVLNIGPENAAKKIIERAVKIKEEVNEDLKTVEYLKTCFAYSKNMIRRALRGVLNNNTSKYTDHKFSNFSPAEVTAILEQFGTHAVRCSDFTHGVINVKKR